MYKRITPAMITQMLEMKQSEEEISRMTEEQKQARETAVHDQYYFIHSNKLVLFGISERHEAIVNNDKNPIVEVSFDINKKNRSDKKVTGKHKSKSFDIKLYFFN